MIFLAGAKDFSEVVGRLRKAMKTAGQVENERWQGIDVSKDPAARMYELRNVTFEVDLRGIEDLDHWRNDIKPNLPWADDHFLERVGGEPLNPGVQWMHWPWGRSADRFRDEKEIFNHTYMERLWPKYSRRTPEGKLPVVIPRDSRKYPSLDVRPNQGVAFSLGDLQDVVELLVKEPSTRQAWIPLFFPEDTGYGDGGRKPCTLGYQFLVRHDRIHVWYPLRSCDLAHHLQDDCYLAVRLMLWVLGQCRSYDRDRWGMISPGTYAMHMTSLHVFENDRKDL